MQFVQLRKDMLRLLGFSLLAAWSLAGAACKDHHTEEAERSGTPAPNQRVPTPEGTYR